MFADRNHGDFVLFHSILDLPGILSPKENADYACQVLEPVSYTHLFPLPWR